jgi:hypothetical protein
MTAATTARSRALRVALAYWLFEAVLSLLIALPVRSMVERAYGAHPDGDAVLFRPGSLELSELVYRFDPAVSLFPTLLVTVAAIALVIGHLPLAGAIAYLDDQDDWARTALRSFFRMLAAFATFGVLRWLVLGAGVALAFWIAGARVELHGEVSAFQWGVAITIPFVLLFWALSAAEDFAYVGVVRAKDSVDAMAATWRTLRTKRVAAMLYFGAVVCGHALLICTASALAASLGGGKAGAALVALFAAHQSVQFARILLKVRWLSYVVQRHRDSDVELPPEPAT